VPEYGTIAFILLTFVNKIRHPLKKISRQHVFFSGKSPLTEPRPYRARAAGWNSDVSDELFTNGGYVARQFDRPFEFELWEYDEGGPF